MSLAKCSPSNTAPAIIPMYFMIKYYSNFVPLNVADETLPVRVLAFSDDDYCHMLKMFVIFVNVKCYLAKNVDAFIDYLLR